MGNEASIAAGALQAKAKMSQALDSVGETLKGEPAAKNPKDYGKMHQKREREWVFGIGWAYRYTCFDNLTELLK